MHFKVIDDKPEESPSRTGHAGLGKKQRGNTNVLKTVITVRIHQAHYPETEAVNQRVVLIYTYATFTVLCQLINIFGMVTNSINIMCFVKQGFKDSINVSLLGLSVSDLCSLITMAGTCVFLTPAVMAADLPFDSVDVSYLVTGTMHFAFTRVSSCITALITLERSLSIVAPLKVKNMLSPRRIALTIVCIFIVFTFSSTPVYVVNRLDVKFSLFRNKTIIGLVFRYDKVKVETIAILVNNVCVPFGAFTIVSVCTVVISTQLRNKTDWRKKTISQVQGDRISNRNKRVAKMVVTISTMFIVCFIPTTIIMLAIAFEPALLGNNKYMYISVIIGGFSYIMEGINSSMNIFIYHNMSSKYRLKFLKLFTKDT